MKVAFSVKQKTNNLFELQYRIVFTQQQTVRWMTCAYTSPNGWRVKDEIIVTITKLKEAHISCWRCSIFVSWEQKKAIKKIRMALIRLHSANQPQKNCISWAEEGRLYCYFELISQLSLLRTRARWMQRHVVVYGLRRHQVSQISPSSWYTAVLLLIRSTVSIFADRLGILHTRHSFLLSLET